jgi:hypothetical protein
MHPRHSPPAPFSLYQLAFRVQIGKLALGFAMALHVSDSRYGVLQDHTQLRGVRIDGQLQNWRATAGFLFD